MANLLLIDPPWYAFQNIPLCKVSYGLASLAAILRQGGHKCIIYNGDFGLLKPPYSREETLINFERYRENLRDDSLFWRKTRGNLKDIIIDSTPSIVGITMPTAKYEIGVRIANWIKKEFPKIIIIVGGPHPTIQPLETIKEESIDIVVKGEGEVTFLELVNALVQKKDIKGILGITGKDDSRIFDNPDREYITELDNLPFPAWDLVYDFEKHNPFDFGTVFTSRGCPYKCSFCASFKIWSRKVRYMSADRVVDELRYTRDKFKVNYFRFNDDTFILDQKRVKEICEKIKNRAININWECEVRADLCTPHLLETIKSAGCQQVNIGVESGNAEILKSIEKGITLEQIYRAFQEIKRVKLQVLAYFMVGFPNETIDTIKDTIRLMNKIRPNYPCWSIVMPYPGTKLYNDAYQKRLIPDKIEWSYCFHHLSAIYLSKNIPYDKFLLIIREIEEECRKIKVKESIKMAFFFLFFHPVKLIKKIGRLCLDFCNVQIRKGSTSYF